MVSIISTSSFISVFFLTYFLAKRWPAISKIIYSAFAIRISILLIGHHQIDLPDSQADAASFERAAWELGQSGFLNVLNNFTGTGPEFITWLIAIPYSILGRNIIMAKCISLLLGIGVVFLGWSLAKKIWDENVANKVGWLITLYPSLILYSVTILREVYIIFFLLIALHGIFYWVNNKSFKSIILVLMGFSAASSFHGAIFIGLLIFLILIGFFYIKKFLYLILTFRTNFKDVIIIVIIFSTMTLYFTSKFRVSYLGTFENSIKIERIFSKTNVSTRGDASWPEWTKINSIKELFYKVPARSFYFLFSPFPWDIKKTSHLIGMIDSILMMYLSCLVIMNLKKILADPVLRIFFIILVGYIILHGIGVGNFGTGIRHRTKFVIIFILLAGPKLIKIFNSKKNFIRYP